jgi:DNA-binding SARP family transcriptional activator
MLRILVLRQLEAKVDGRSVTLWPDVLDASALKSLRSALCSLRRALGAAAEAVIGDHDRVGLDPDSTSIDLAEFETLAAAAAR